MGAISSFIVAVPAYNEELTILQTLDSVLAASLRTEAKLETIVVCINGCTDATEQVVAAWGKAPLIIVHSKPSLINAMNRLITYAHEHYPDAAFIKTDGDSIVDPDAFALIFAQLDKHPELMIAGGHPMPIINRELPRRHQFVSMVTSVRGRVPQAEVATKNVAHYHRYAATDPLPGMDSREEKLKIYFHGRLWCMRTGGLLPFLPKDAIGEDVFLPGWLFKAYGLASIRIDYRAKVYFHPNDSLRRHWKVYRRVYEDRFRVYAMDGFYDYATHCPLKLDWKYILTKAPKKELPYFILYAVLCRVEKFTFRITDYRDSYWQYWTKEV